MHCYSSCPNSVHDPSGRLDAPPALPTRDPPNVPPAPASSPYTSGRLITAQSKQKLYTYDSQIDEGIDLKTPMILKCPVHIRIRSPKKFFVSTDTPQACWMLVDVCTAANSVILYSSSSTVRLKPLYRLGETFMRYWNKIPEEVREMIITENMITHPIRQSFRSRGKGLGLLLAHCRMSPQIARLATKAFYKENEWLIELHNGTRKGVNRYPSPMLNQFIRRVLLTMYIRRSQWTFLRRLAEGRFGFENMKYLSIKISWNFPGSEVEDQDWDAFLDETRGNLIMFSCAGDVSVLRVPPSWIMSGRKFIPNVSAKEAIIQGRIMFGVEEAEL